MFIIVFRSGVQSSQRTLTSKPNLEETIVQPPSTLGVLYFLLVATPSTLGVLYSILVVEGQGAHPRVFPVPSG